MSTTFHPAEEGKLEPIKTRSAELAAAASAWLKSTPPAEFNKPAILAKLKLLDAESAALDALIKGKKATDAEITAALTKLHDLLPRDRRRVQRARSKRRRSKAVAARLSLNSSSACGWARSGECRWAGRDQLSNAPRSGAWFGDAFCPQGRSAGEGPWCLG